MQHAHFQHAIVHLISHEIIDQKDVAFPSPNGPDRSFSLLLTEGNPEAQELGWGIAIIDNDNGLVLAEGIQPVRGATNPRCPTMTLALEALSSMNWTKFRDFCARRPEYRGGAPDIDGRYSNPLPGNQRRQSIATGGDLRTPEMQAIDADDDLPYVLPALSRKKMIEALVTHPCRETEHGFFLSWSHEPNKPWNRTGRIRGSAKVDPNGDHDWREFVAENPEVLDEAKAAALTPYLDHHMEILDFGEKSRCMLEMEGEGSNHILLTAVAGQPVLTASRAEFVSWVSGLDNEDLVTLWASVAVLDADLSSNELADLYAAATEKLRVAYESDTLLAHP